VPKDQKIPASKFKAALAGKYGPKAAAQARFKKNVLKGRAAQGATVNGWRPTASAVKSAQTALKRSDLSPEARQYYQQFLDNAAKTGYRPPMTNVAPQPPLDLRGQISPASVAQGIVNRGGSVTDVINYLRGAGLMAQPTAANIMNSGGSVTDVINALKAKGLVGPGARFAKGGKVAKAKAAKGAKVTKAQGRKR
jgi:hypothetical protein